MASQFIEERRKSLERELANQQNWLKKRAEEINGPVGGAIATQPTLLDGTHEMPHMTVPAWQKIDNPAERLAAFHGDRQQPSALRAEAEGVLRILSRASAT